MSKKAISATIEESTVEKINSICKEEHRSFSQMINILLELAIPIFKSGKKVK